MHLPKASRLDNVTHRRCQHRRADQEREHQNDPHRALELVNRAPQWIAVGPDPSSDPLPERNPRSSLRAPVPRPSHQDSIPALASSHPAQAGHVRAHRTSAGRPRRGVCTPMTGTCQIAGQGANPGAARFPFPRAASW
jgi:hypothetical protein